MKIIIKISAIILIIINLYSCDKNDDVSTPINKFTVNSLDFDTPNCYIEYDINGNNQFNLFFLDGRMHVNNSNVSSSSNEYIFSTNTSDFVFFNITETDNPSITIPFYPNIVPGTAYIASNGDSVIMHGFSVSPLSPNVNFNGFDFGDPDPTSGGVLHQPMIGNTNTITINSFNFDSITQTGNIDVDYQFLDALGNSIIGHYEGALGVLLD